MSENAQKNMEPLRGRVTWQPGRAFSDVYDSAEKISPGFGAALEEMLPGFDYVGSHYQMLSKPGEAVLFADGSVAVTTGC
jgi:hypothetical protein